MVYDLLLLSIQGRVEEFSLNNAQHHHCHGAHRKSITTEPSEDTSGLSFTTGQIALLRGHSAPHLTQEEAKDIWGCNFQ